MPGQLALEHHGWIVAVAQHHEAFTSIGPLEAQHIQAAQTVSRRLVQHHSIRPRRGPKYAAADLLSGGNGWG